MNLDLDNYRKQIDKIDREIVTLLVKRFEVVEKIANYKKKNNLQILDIEREKNILKEKVDLAKSNNLDEEFVLDIFKKIMEQAKKNQNRNIKQ